MQGSSEELADRLPMLRISSNSNAASNVVEVVDDEPPLLEQMMQAAAEAKQKQQQEKAVQARKESKGSFGGAFKKGFLNSSPKPKAQANPAVKPAASTKASPVASVPTQPQQKPNAAPRASDGIPTITSRPAASLHVFSEVQDALAEEQASLLGQLKPEHWMTDDLMQRFAQNPILIAGMQNPQMSAALQEFQASPQQAMLKYRDHEPIRNFLMEFSRLMGEHFTKLGEAQERERQAQAAQASSQAAVREVGPLEQKAIEAHKANLKSQAPVVVSQAEQQEQERVQRILNDPELSRMLMDPHVQRMIQECGDPRKLQVHMRNPQSAAILNKLIDAGLVQVAR